MNSTKSFIILLTVLCLTPACMIYPGNGEVIHDPFREIVFSGYVYDPNHKVYVYIKNTQTNEYLAILDATTNTIPRYTDHDDPPKKLYQWEAEGTFDDYAKWEGYAGFFTINVLRVIPSLVPPNADRTGPNSSTQRGTLLIFKPGPAAREEIAIYQAQNPSTWTAEHINQQWGLPGMGAASIMTLCGPENRMCCNTDGFKCNTKLRCRDGRCVASERLKQERYQDAFDDLR